VLDEPRKLARSDIFFFFFLGVGVGGTEIGIGIGKWGGGCWVMCLGEGSVVREGMI
jgi:hypothetical protein